MKTEVTLSWGEIEILSKEVAKIFSTSLIEGIIGISRGGLIPSVIIAQSLGISRIESFSIQSYIGQDRGVVRVGKMPLIDNGGKGWLIIDDLVDTGITMREARRLVPNAQSAVLLAKPEGRTGVDRFARMVEQSAWITFPWEALQ